MPTAVEHGFLKLDAFDSLGAQYKLSEAFLKIDSAFAALEGAPDTAAFLKLEDSGAIKLEFARIGGAFIKLGDGVGDIANAALKLDDFVIKLAGAGASSVPTGAAATVGGVDPQTDFLKLDAALSTSAGDLKLFGADFLKLDDATSVSDFQVKLDTVGTDAGALGSDMAANQSAFEQLGQDFITLGGGDATGAGGPISDIFYKALGADLYKIGADFGNLSTDFLKLESAISSGGVSAGSAIALFSAPQGGGAGPIGSAFATLDQDFISLSKDLAAAGGVTAAAIGDFIHKYFGGGGGGKGA